MDGKTQVVKHFNLVEMEFKGYRPSAEFHTEDWIINESFAPKFIKHLNDDEIIFILNKMSITNLKEALKPKDKSLFIVKAQEIVKIWHEQWEKFKVRMSFIDQAGNLFEKIPVTDLLTLAFVRYRLEKGNTNYNTELINAFNNNSYRYIRIGLTRPAFGRPYWEQVTALITIPDLFDNYSFSYFEEKLGRQV